MRPGQAAPVFDRIEIDGAMRHPASMRPGQAAPVFGRPEFRPAGQQRASMRPGQAAPVFPSIAVDKGADVNSLQ